MDVMINNTGLNNNGVEAEMFIENVRVKIGGHDTVLLSLRLSIAIGHCLFQCCQASMQIGLSDQDFFRN